MVVGVRGVDHTTGAVGDGDVGDGEGGVLRICGTPGETLAGRGVGGGVRAGGGTPATGGGGGGAETTGSFAHGSRRRGRTRKMRFLVWVGLCEIKGGKEKEKI